MRDYSKNKMDLVNCVALLRGINVGGKNKLPMKDLIEIIIAAKCKNVRSFIQSGNILFDAPPKVVARIPEIISAQIAKRFGYRIPVVLRTRDEMEKIVSGNPFVKTGAAMEALHVMFLAEAPSADKMASLDPNRSPPGEFVAMGREVYLKLPKGVAQTKLTNAYFDAKLRTTGTQRNWRTVTKLLELSRLTQS